MANKNTGLYEQLGEKWDSFLDNPKVPTIAENHRKNVTAQLLENTADFYERNGGFNVLNETTNSTHNTDNVDPVIMGLVRRTAPNLMAYDLGGVQPMTGPTGLIFAMRAFYNSAAKGPYGRPGDARNEFQTGSDLDSNGNTVAEANGVNRKASGEAFYDEADHPFSGREVNYAGEANTAYDGQYDIGEGMYTKNGEYLGRGQSGDGDFNEMSFTIEKTSVEATTRALKAEYTMELAQDLRAVHGLDAENELANILSTEILAEINRQYVNTIRRVAVVSRAEPVYANGSIVTDSNDDVVLGMRGEWDIDTNSDGRWSAEKYKSLLVKISKEANAIAKTTRRGRGNLVICSSDVATVLDLTGKMDYSPAIDNNLNVDDTGNTFVGVLQGRFRVYIDPYLDYDEVIVGYRGSNQMDAGLFYCPYVPLQMVKALGENNFQPKIAFKTRYGMVANPFTSMDTHKNVYYRKFKVRNL